MQVPGKVPGVVLGAMDETRLAAPQYRQPDHVQSRRIDHTAVVLQAALAVEYRHFEPRIVRAKPGSPDDGASAVPVEVERQRRRLRYARRRKPFSYNFV